MDQIHPLAVWIDAQGTRAAFAKRVGTSESHLSLILKGRRGTSLKLALAIERETGGRFRPSDLPVTAEAD